MNIVTSFTLNAWSANGNTQLGICFYGYKFAMATDNIMYTVSYNYAHIYVPRMLPFYPTHLVFKQKLKNLNQAVTRLPVTSIDRERGAGGRLRSDIFNTIWTYENDVKIIFCFWYEPRAESKWLHKV